MNAPHPPHHHHRHDGHAHRHAPRDHAAPAVHPRWNGLLAAGVAPRLAGAVGLLVLLWLGVAWSMG